MKNISFITALHGNETSPVLALASINANFLVANPEALKQNVRFIENDMNKSFNTNGNSYEEVQARILLEKIPKENFVIDFHTTSCVTEPFAIITKKSMLNLAKKTGLKHIVYMQHNIKSGHALIDHTKGVSIETGTHSTKEAFETTLKIYNHLSKTSPKENKVNIYVVDGVIEKEGNYQNFDLANHGFVPILAGEQSYPFASLKGKLVSEVDLNIID